MSGEGLKQFIDDNCLFEAVAVSTGWHKKKC